MLFFITKNYENDNYYFQSNITVELNYFYQKIIVYDETDRVQKCNISSPNINQIYVDLQISPEVLLFLRNHFRQISISIKNKHTNLNYNYD